jgi:hypothetical protein
MFSCSFTLAEEAVVIRVTALAAVMVSTIFSEQVTVRTMLRIRL